MRTWAEQGVQVQTVVTSPPYWGLRDYKTHSQVWGGDPECEHAWKLKVGKLNSSNRNFSYGSDEDVAANPKRNNFINSKFNIQQGTCTKCGAWLGELGLEDTPEEYVKHLASIFDEVYKILRPDGTVFLNLGDSYVSAKSKHSSRQQTISGASRDEPIGGNRPDLKGHPYLKDKDRAGIPHRVVFALQEAGWYWRDEIIWQKPSCMPESTEDRCTKQHEFIFMLTKSPRYYYDQFAIRQPAKNPKDLRRPVGSQGAWEMDGWAKGANGGGKPYEHDTSMSNPRSVWAINTSPYAGSHFAVFPIELPSRCIKAGTSAYGCCAKCGKPYKRILDKSTFSSHDGESDTLYERGTSANRLAMLRQAARKNGNEYCQSIKSTGWEPMCKCNAEVVPCIVFDPFMGSGTTAEAAIRLGRSYLGCELNPDYKPLQDRRIAHGDFMLNNSSEGAATLIDDFA